MLKRNRRNSAARGAGSRVVWAHNIGGECGLWYETPTEIRRELRRGFERARLLAWVRREMVLSLTSDERQCLELHYFRYLTYDAVSQAMNRHKSAVYRTVQRAIRKLRKRAEAQGGARKILKAGRRALRGR